MEEILQKGNLDIDTKIKIKQALNENEGDKIRTDNKLLTKEVNEDQMI